MRFMVIVKATKSSEAGALPSEELLAEMGKFNEDLWIDRVPGLSQAEIWLELITNDISAASEHLKKANVVRCDEIEPLPEGFQAFWVSSPASIVHLVCKDTESWQAQGSARMRSRPGQRPHSLGHKGRTSRKEIGNATSE